MSHDEDPYSEPDKDETVPELQQDKTRSSQLPKILGVSEMSLSQWRHDNIRVVKEGEKTSREVQDEQMLKNDSLRKKYDLRNVDPKTINNIFLRAHIKELSERSKPNAEIKPIDATTEA